MPWSCSLILHAAQTRVNAQGNPMHIYSESSPTVIKGTYLQETVHRTATFKYRTEVLLLSTTLSPPTRKILYAKKKNIFNALRNCAFKALYLPCTLGDGS